MEAAWENQNYREWFNANIYNLAKDYATKHPVIGMEREDYVQELVMRVWRALPKYNPKKASLSTFAVIWFGSKRYELTAAIIRASNGFGSVRSLSEETTEDGNELSSTIAAEEPDYSYDLDAREAYGSVCVESRMFYSGYTLCQISHELSKPMALVQQAIEADIARLRREFGIENV